MWDLSVIGLPGRPAALREVGIWLWCLTTILFDEGGFCQGLSLACCFSSIFRRASRCWLCLDPARCLSARGRDALPWLATEVPVTSSLQSLEAAMVPLQPHFGAVCRDERHGHLLPHSLLQDRARQAEKRSSGSCPTPPPPRGLPPPPRSHATGPHSAA